MIPIALAVLSGTLYLQLSPSPRRRWFAEHCSFVP